MTGEQATDGEVTLHRRILGDVEGRILSGEWRPGHRIPFENELAAHYGCSRMTVNKVLTQLARTGLIERKKGSGSFVLKPKAQSAVLEISDIEAEVLSLNQSYSFEILDRAQRKLVAGENGLLDGVLVGSTILHVVCMHYAGMKPFCLEERLVNLTTIPLAADADFGASSPGKWLLEQIPWTSAEHRIQAVSADSETAKSLQLRKQTACLRVERWTWSGSASVTYVRLTYPGDRHALVARFTPRT